MKRKAFLLFFVFGFLVFSKGFSSPQDSLPDDFPSLEPYITLDFSSPNLSPKQIITAALQFSSYPAISTADFLKYLSMYNELEKRVTNEKFQSYSDEVKAEEVLMLMYEKTLLRYSLKQTRLTTVFDEGTYNCVSASVLYLALAKAAGLNVIGNRAPDHCFCSVIIDGKKIDVETTNPMGFNPGEKKMLDSTKYAVVPKKMYKGRYEVSDAMLVSLVAKNINGLQMEKKDYLSAFPISAARLVFVANDNVSEKNDSRSDFDITASNFSAELQQQKRYYDSMLWLDAVVDRWGISKGLEQNYGDSIYNAILYFVSQKDFKSASSNLASHKDFLTQKDYESLSQRIFVFETSDNAEKISSFEEKMNYLKKQKNNPLAKNKNVEKQLNQSIENTWLLKIFGLIEKEDYLGAANLCSSALEDLPDSANIKRIRQSCLNNYDAVIHNQFADYANAGKFKNAKSVLEEGLKNNPNSTTLKNDMNRLNRMMR